MDSIRVNPKWKEKMDITYEQYFRTPYEIPHEGFVMLVRAMEEKFGREKAHELLLEILQRHQRELAARRNRVKPVEKLMDLAEHYLPRTGGHATRLPLMERRRSCHLPSSG